MIETNKNYFKELSVVNVNNLEGLHNSQTLKRPVLRLGIMTGTTVKKICKDRQIDLKCPFIFMTYPGSVYKWEVPHNAVRNSFFFDIKGKRADAVCAMLREDFPDGVLEISNSAPFKNQLEEISKNFYDSPPLFNFRLAYLAEGFLTMLYDEFVGGTNHSKYEKLIFANAETMKNAPGGNHNFQNFAKNLGITEVHYRRIFKNLLGVPPGEYLQQCRLLLAEKLLKKEKQMQIQEIAMMCGFSNSTEFSRFFRNRTGISPSSYSNHYTE